MKDRAINNFKTIISIAITICAGITVLFLTKEITSIIENHFIFVVFFAAALAVILFQIFIHYEKINSIERKTRKLAKLIQVVTCYNQKSFLDYHTIASEHHRLLKNHLSKNNIDEEELKIAFEECSKFSVENLRRILSFNINLLEKYYKDNKEDKVLPNICIKVFKNNQFETIATNNNYFSKSKEYVEESTGIKYVTEHGRYYLCNNIPKAAAEGTYYNPRFDNKMARNIELDIFSLLYKKRFNKKWCACWQHEYCHKSSFIIPITLTNNNMSDQFRRHFKIKDIGRSVWGLISIDHTEINYFNYDRDVHIGCIFADLLSLYLVTTYMLTEGSNTYHKAKQILDLPEKGIFNIISLDLYGPIEKIR